MSFLKQNVNFRMQLLETPQICFALLCQWICPSTICYLIIKNYCKTRYSQVIWTYPSRLLKLSLSYFHLPYLQFTYLNFPQIRKPTAIVDKMLPIDINQPTVHKIDRLELFPVELEEFQYVNGHSLMLQTCKLCEVVCLISRLNLLFWFECIY